MVLPCSYTQKNGKWVTNEGSKETMHKCSLSWIFPAHIHKNGGWVTSEGSKATVHKCSLSRIFPAHIHKNGGWVTSEGSDETVHKYSLVRISPAHLHTIWSLNDQRRLRWDCVHVKSRQNLPCSLTHNMEPKWPAKAQIQLCSRAVSTESPLLT